jgi:hypothetical protein
METIVNAIASHDNIAILILLFICAMQWVVIGRLLAVVMKVSSSLQPLVNAIDILNERLHPQPKTKKKGKK